MAGEIEEPIRLDFQAGSIHSGSISFGRFETETLCWERRSSFSHNRYLEEVEKCSKPGLVFEKKAYFEAHFRKKGILRLSSPESSNEYQTSENDVIEKTGYDDETNQSDAVYDRTSTCEAQFERICDATDSVDCISDQVKVGSFSEIEVEVNLDGEKSNIDTSHTPHNVTICPFGDNRSTEGNSDATSAISQQDLSSKEKIQLQVDIAKPTLAPQVGAAQSKRNIFNKSSKISEQTNNKTVNNVQIRSKADKKISLADAKGKRQMHKTPKNECDTKAKGDKDDSKRSEIISRNRRIKEPQSSTMRKVSSEVHQRENRVNSAVRMPQPCVKQDNYRLRFKGNDRAERRKEFDTKFEEKTHAKEAKMHQLQSKTQEKTEAEIKQLRKSLNFKATPLPSFYRDSDRTTATTSDSRSQKKRTKSSIPGTRVSERSRLSCTAGKHEASGPQASTSCHSTVTSDSNPSSPSAVYSKGLPSQAVINSQQKHKGAEVKKSIDRGKIVNAKLTKATERTIHAAFKNASRTDHKTVVTA
ncbi:hypothetical protein CASFOL_024376 [Castilleja foliolosa]|uniref:TPX2 C-terminal domain-containing protein n=1 Tax=Castilleja foliolosa TaxID=1961234 RepID=A0ABD3CP62_9LAMI